MQQELKHAVFLGSKALGLSVFKALYAISGTLKWTIVHPNDASDARSALQDWQNLARLLDLDLLISNSKAATKDILQDLKPDIGFVCGWYSLLDGETLSLVPNGLWGIHNSLLPKYRGGSPLVWSILNGEPHVGSTVFKISEGMDDGDILLQIRVTNTPSDSVASLLQKIEFGLLQALPEKWKLLIGGSVSLTQQSENDASFCGQRVESDGLIDWSRSAEDVHNFIRAQSLPYPCAFTFYGQKKLKILQSQVFGGVYCGSPGQIVKRNLDSLIVACGKNTAVVIDQISVDEDICNAAQYIKSMSIRFQSQAAPPLG